MRRFKAIEIALVGVVLASLAAVILIKVHTGGSSTPPPSPRPTAARFASTYTDYLDGRDAAATLVDASARARAIAAAGGVIPASARRGRLTLTGLQFNYVVGSDTAQTVVRYRDAAGRSYPVDLGLAYGGGRWSVVYLVPPDLGTILSAAHHVAPAPEPLVAAARRFALAYADFRARATRALPPGLPTILGQIRAGSDPLGQAPLTGGIRLQGLAMGPVQGNIATATASLRDAASSVRLSFNLQRVAGRWQAWSFPETAG